MKKAPTTYKIFKHPEVPKNGIQKDYLTNQTMGFVYACEVFWWSGYARSTQGKGEMHTQYSKGQPSDPHPRHKLYPAVKKYFNH